MYSSPSLSRLYFIGSATATTTPFEALPVALAYELPRDPAPMMRIRGGFADIAGRGGAGRRSTSLSTVGESAWGAMMRVLGDILVVESRVINVYRRQPNGFQPRSDPAGGGVFRYMQRCKPVTSLAFQLHTLRCVLNAGTMLMLYAGELSFVMLNVELQRWDLAQREGALFSLDPKAESNWSRPPRHGFIHPKIRE